MKAGEAAALIVSWAVEEGFDRAGIVRLRPSEHAEAFERWLGRGDQASMAYLERRRAERLDPRRLFEGARSALCVARQYHPGGDRAELPPESVLHHVARYARGTDYHDLLKKRLVRLAARIEEAFPGATTRPYVDTGPVLERELAARAGIGSFGKNTNLLHPEAGSWFFLGEIFTTLDLELATPVADLCGSCTRCLEACPTGALPEPYRLDATRCISYWTIEHRGWLPEEARQLPGDWIFGCDVCQEVCPVNEDGAVSVESALEPDPRRRQLKVLDLLDLSRRSYVELFRGSPMKRAKLEGLQRNAVLWLAHRGGEEAEDALVGALRHDEPLVRGHAAWGLGRLAGAAARRALEKALEGEPEPEVREEIRSALGRVSEGS